MKHLILTTLALLCVCATLTHAAPKSYRVPMDVRTIPPFSWNDHKNAADIIKAAEAGDMYCQYYVATRHEIGSDCGIPQDIEQALALYEKSAEQGFAPAMYRLARWYGGEGLRVTNDERAFTWFRRAAEAGDAESMSALGMIYFRGDCGQEPNEAEAVRWLTKAAKLGEQYAIWHLREYKAVQNILPKTKSDDPADLYAVGQYLLENRYGSWQIIPNLHTEAYSRNAAENPDYAAEHGVEAPGMGYYEKAARMGYAPAQRDFGLIRLAFIAGSDWDHAEGVKYLQQAADAGDADAILWLGICYAQGKGVERDDVKAFQLLSDAEAKDANYADEMLAYAYLQGVGTEPDTEKALALLRKMTYTDPGAAEYRLGEIAFDAHDYPQAVRWLQVASDAGHDDAKLQLALCHLCGQGTPINDTMAVTLMRESESEYAGQLLELCRILGISGTAPKAGAPQSVLEQRLQSSDMGADDIMQLHAAASAVHLLRRDFAAAEKNFREVEPLLEKLRTMTDEEEKDSYDTHVIRENAPRLLYCMIPFHAAGWGTPRDEEKALAMFDQIGEIMEIDEIGNDAMKFATLALFFDKLDEKAESAYWLGKLSEIDSKEMNEYLDQNMKKPRENLLQAVTYGPCRQGPTIGVDHDFWDTFSLFFD